MPDALSAGNPAVKRLRRLVRSARARRSEGVVVVEGPRALDAAVTAGADVEVVLVEDGAFTHLIEDLETGGVPVRPVRPGVLDRVLSTRSPLPIAGVVRRPAGGGPDGVDPPIGPTVVLAEVSDPGNVGTIIRSAVAAGAGPVVVGPRCADPFGPKAVRASAGSVFEAVVDEVADLTSALGALRSSGATVLGAAPRGGCAPEDVDLTGPVAIVLGAETAGLPDAVSGDRTVSIPRAGPVESLNVAMAATVLLFEAARQRRAVDRQ